MALNGNFYTPTKSGQAPDTEGTEKAEMGIHVAETKFEARPKDSSCDGMRNRSAQA